MKLYQSQVRYSDGSIRPVVYECWTTTLHARYAAQIVGAMAGINQTKDGDDQLSPKMVAVRACDIAQQLVTEFEERGWIVELPDVVPPPSVAAPIEPREKSGPSTEP